MTDQPDLNTFVGQFFGEPTPTREPEHAFDAAFLSAVWGHLEFVSDQQADAALSVLVQGLSGESVPSWAQDVYNQAHLALADHLRYPDENVPTLVTALRAWRSAR